jgi:hypothetical protein
LGHQHINNIGRDLAIIFLSIVMALVVVETGVVHWFVSIIDGWQYLSILVAGVMFTSMFTTAPAMVVLAEIALGQPVWLVASLGALGAMGGDFFIYRFVKDNLADDLQALLQLAPKIRFPAIFRSRIFRWLPPLIGALIIASPLPDELGVTILGVSKAPKVIFLLISFSFNFIGIAAVCWIARAL